MAHSLGTTAPHQKSAINQSSWNSTHQSHRSNPSQPLFASLSSFFLPYFWPPRADKLSRLHPWHFLSAAFRCVVVYLFCFIVFSVDIDQSYWLAVNGCHTNKNVKSEQDLAKLAGIAESLLIIAPISQFSNRKSPSNEDKFFLFHCHFPLSFMGGRGGVLRERGERERESFPYR